MYNKLEINKGSKLSFFFKSHTFFEDLHANNFIESKYKTNRLI